MGLLSNELRPKYVPFYWSKQIRLTLVTGLGKKNIFTGQNRSG